MTTPEATALLQEAAGLEREYNQQAGSWQRLHFRLRITVLVLGILAALAGVLARTVLQTYAQDGSLVTLLIGLPTLTVLLMGLIYWINPGQRWVAYRSGSEGLKSRAFAFATSSDAMGSPEQRVASFRKGLEDLRQQVADQQPRGLFTRIGEAWNRWFKPAAPPLGPDRAPDVPEQLLDPETYISQRLLSQRDWYYRRSRDHRTTQGWLSLGMLLFNLAVGLLVIVQMPEWIPVATTIVGALATFSALANAEFLANSYRATVAQLDELLQSWRRGDYLKVRNGFTVFVSKVEQVISREYTGWNQMQPNDRAD